MFPPVIATVGGGGTRLYPLTLDQPKPLVDLCDTAIIATLFRVLANQGCRRFILGSKGADNTLPLNNYFKAGEGFFKRLGISDIEEFSYQPQYEDRGSADSLRYCASYFDIAEDALVVSGDNVIDINLRNFIDFHKDKGAVLTVALKELGPDEEISQYGVADIDADHRINGFVEKPAPGKEPSRMINTAFYLFSPEVRDVLAEMGDSARDIGGDLIPYLTEHGYPVYGYPVEGYWIDIGTPERLLLAAMDFLGGKVEHYAFRNEYRPGQWVNPRTLDRIGRYLDSGDIELIGNVFIGRNCNIEKGVVIENSHIGHTSLIERGSKIRNSMVMSFAHIKRGAVLKRTIVGRHSTIGPKCVLDADQSCCKPGKIPVVGENVTLPQESVVGPGTRVAPLKYSYKILATGKFSQLGTDDQNIYFCEK
ncbi:NDP-sugar synthase [Methanotrichaceae archaeon M04Ac]|uniref:Bifunctional protein GlmU n=1 Tax=Candidatus Methanocrinis alkalitolerans TaxID=3033395 RepID=A0ABT5XEJ3_9EURY|nr:NDP-sugar synthase [Candidatus Methanocrinis alkalitolerans]MCR3883918.1 NDP-sugar synthase [Methanothrix sp.]MDF0593080.1 NDP-sugar synthase [Candidatus Methanocrinis alkalitolerans]